MPYTRIGFRPMRELVDLLAANAFQVYICSGGGRDFVRVVSAEMYGISRERVIGSGTSSNADGDTAMLETARFGLLVRHDDADPEFANDQGAEKALGEAADRGWTVVSMRDDFVQVF